jgi:RecA/RadA recombinase
LQTRVLASGFRRLSFIAFKTETAVLVLNQIRSAGGADAQEVSSAGPTVKLHSALRILLEPLESGLRARFRIVKNRYATPVRSGELRFEFRGDSPESL